MFLSLMDDLMAIILAPMQLLLVKRIAIVTYTVLVQLAMLNGHVEALVSIAQ